MDKDVSQNRQLRLLWGDLAVVRAEGCAEALEGRRRVELVNLPLDLLRDELSLEVCDVSAPVTYIDRMCPRLTVLLLSCERLARRRPSISCRRSDRQVDGGIWCRLGGSAIDGRGFVSGLSSHGS